MCKRSAEPIRRHYSPRVGVPGGYMVPDVDAGKRTLVLQKSRKHS